MEPREALDGLIVERGETYASISRLLGRNSAYIQQFIKRGSPARLDQSDIALLALHFDVPPEVLGGKERKGRQSGSAPSSKSLCWTGRAVAHAHRGA